MYYRGAHAAVICYEPSCSESWARLRHWLQELRTVEEECKVYLCGTKKDLLDSGAVKREVPEDLVATYSQGLRGHFLTSSKTGENVAIREREKENVRAHCFILLISPTQLPFASPEHTFRPWGAGIEYCTSPSLPVGVVKGD
ncbi:hypothetical protein evm_014079 [Chilo suppressalis]|nr:hypothetical protein evm_014079 [Chilo suppressalis]